MQIGIKIAKNVILLRKINITTISIKLFMKKSIFTFLVSVSLLFSVAFLVNANNAGGNFSAGDMAVTHSFMYNAEGDDDTQFYRRLRSIRDDHATTEGSEHLDPDAENPLDAPKVLRIVSALSSNDYLYEDALSAVSANRGGIGFLGATNFSEEIIYPDGTAKFNYHLFFDTAYINRGTGHIKPQYMIAVGTKAVKRQEITGKDHTGATVTKTIKSYVEGRYLINATDSARELGSNGSHSYTIRDERYILQPSHDRLAFIDAIHVYEDDRLYIVSELVRNRVTRDQYIITTANGEEFIDGDALDLMTQSDGKLAGKECIPDNSHHRYGAYYQFGTWDNYHNDVCFSLRFASPTAKNPDESGVDVVTNYEKRFYIESEAPDRNPQENNKIAPEYRGNIRINYGAAILERNTFGGISYADIFNVAEPPFTDWQDGKATLNENIASEVKIIAGEEFITIYNAVGKHIVVSNLLGRTIVNKTLTSNNEVIKAPKGFVVATVDGEKSFKLMVK